MSSPFERALADEAQWLCKVVNRPMPSDFLAGQRVYIGPANFPWDALHYLGPDARPDPSLAAQPSIP